MLDGHGSSLPHARLYPSSGLEQAAKQQGAACLLDRRHFDELLREPLLRSLDYAEALDKVRRGALWLDVRYPSEYQYDKLAGAINVPLAEVRNMFAVLDRSKEYIAYCQSGRRSAAAAFLFAQRGFKVWLLQGGLKKSRESGQNARS